MRIIHLSDIHLSSINIEDLQLYYLDCLINDLKKQINDKQVDLIIITGDLVDRGGVSLINIEEYRIFNNPFDIFRKEFIDKVCDKLPIIPEQILFISGNHDIQGNKTNEILDAGLKSIFTKSEEVNRICNLFKNSEFLNFNKLENFLNFEENYHAESIKKGTYFYSDFESTYIYNFKGFNIGIMLANDSWRCTQNKVENHFMGSNQFMRALKIFEQNNTILNIAVMHHPLEIFNHDEKKNIENILKNKKFQILLNGHEHSNRVSIIGHDKKRFVTISGRSAFDKPYEKDSEYISGYSIIDIDFNTKKITNLFRRYYKNRYLFDVDLDNEEPFTEYDYEININENELKNIYNSKNNFINDYTNINNFINNFENED
ncbi:metallophosphoesterase family protein [Flavobacterium faecale]|uniref:metallophosphoesterase family protein n=1 Tax=Flavobacterium faecale TaxID=1355330 RepID=UPI003AAA3EA6